MSRRTAAALLITRGEGPSLELLLCERAPELRFFGGYHALPGGVLDESDWRDAGDGPKSEDLALQRCAERELFEETGLLRRHAAHGGPDTGALVALRKALLAQERQGDKSHAESPWTAFAAGLPQPLPLQPLCRIQTPPFAPVRYDTVFFHAPLDQCTGGTKGGEPDIWPGELTGGRFFRPQEALALWRQGALLLVPPVVILCEHLEAAASFDEFLAAIGRTTNGYAQGRLHQVRFSPGIVLAPLRTPTLPPAVTTNCLIVGHEELWVVDPGSPDAGEQQRLLALLDELCAKGARLSGILSTHHHPDHVGGIAALCEARSLRVRGHQRTLSRLPAGCALGEPLDDGDTIALGTAPDGSAGWTLRAIHTPGHDQGHLCFSESRYGAAIVGDMLSTISTIIIDPPEGDLAVYLRSLERLLQEPLSTLYPAHGPAARNGERLIRQYLRHRRQRETSLIGALQQGPLSEADLLPKVYWDADPKLYPFAARSLLAGLQKLAQEGKAQAEGGLWRLLPGAADGS